MSQKNLNLRRRISKMTLLGWSAARIARAVGVSGSRVKELLKEMGEEGREEFLAKSARRGKHAAASEARAVLEAELQKDPWTLGRWSVEDVHALLAARGIALARPTVYAILYRLGYRTRWHKDHPKESA